jgi:hypothetical protein
MFTVIWEEKLLSQGRIVWRNKAPGPRGAGLALGGNDGGEVDCLWLTDGRGGEKRASPPENRDFWYPPGGGLIFTN